MSAPEHNADDIAVAYAAVLGLPVEDVNRALQEIVKGCTEDGLFATSAAAHTMLRLAKDEMHVADRMTWDTDARGNPLTGRYHPTFFDIESKEGQARRREARDAKKEARACLREMRQHFAQSAAFRVLLGDGRALRPDAQVSDAEEETDDQKSVSEFRKRVIDTANEAEKRTRERMEEERHKPGRGPIKRQQLEGRAGLKKVAELEERLGRDEDE